MKLVYNITALLTLMLVSISLAFASSVDKVQIVSTSQENQSAVIKMQDGSVKNIKLGDDIFGEQAAEGKNGTVKSAEQKKAMFKPGDVVRITPAGSDEQKAGSAKQEVTKGQQMSDGSVKYKGRAQNSKQSTFKSQIKVVEVLDGKVILEELTSHGLETIILSLVENKTADGKGQKGKVTKVTRISKQPDGARMSLGVKQISIQESPSSGRLMTK
jgi:hypothetical protein